MTIRYNARKRAIVVEYGHRSLWICRNPRWTRPRISNECLGCWVFTGGPLWLTALAAPPATGGRDDG